MEDVKIIWCTVYCFFEYMRQIRRNNFAAANCSFVMVAQVRANHGMKSIF